VTFFKRPFISVAIGMAVMVLHTGSISVTPAGTPASGTITISSTVSGKSPRYIGFNNGHYMPGSNTTAWAERSGINTFRCWASPTYYEPVDDLAPYGDGVVDVVSFDARKAALRADPENPLFVNWPAWNNRFENYVQPGRNRCTLNHMLRELRSIDVEIQAMISREAWSAPGTWGDRWEHWQCFYVMAYHMARNFDVALYETYNEPDLDPLGMSQDEYVEWLRFASDAIRSAVSDVNTRFGKSLVPQILAPCITHASAVSGDHHMDADPDSDTRDDRLGSADASKPSY
jgi:hypothetical protein